jgi:hypothetical protein
MTTNVFPVTYFDIIANHVYGWNITGANDLTLKMFNLSGLVVIDLD